jgi:4-hydroxythreonine-4-phosphate dehydrogenase
MFKAFRQKEEKPPSSAKPIALSMGEPSGIGIECLLKSWQAREEEKLPPFFVVADADDVARQAKHLRLSVPTRVIAHPEEAASVFQDALPILPLKLNSKVTFGKPDPANAALVQDSIKIATELVIAKKALALVTLPIHKSTLYHSGFAFAGHTEYLASLCNSTKSTVMMLEVPGLRVALSTVHLSLKDALEKISTNLITGHALVVERALRQMFSIEKPRLAVAALNPHAGEQGALGLEEIEIITPAIEQLRERGIQVTGPHPADTMFHEAMRATYDCAICLYHDQGLIPIKTLDFHGGVNITLGLPIVRTSPDHGTAFDIAGRGKANAASVIRAIKRAEMLAAAWAKEQKAA